jgi:hypothetical protein
MSSLPQSSESSFPFAFEHAPIVIGGLALELMGIRKSGNDCDYIIHPEDYARMRLHFAEFAGFPDTTPGIKVPDTANGVEQDFFRSICGLDYAYFALRARRITSNGASFFVAARTDLILLKAIVGFYEDSASNQIPHPTARKKAFADLELLICKDVTK